MLRPGGGLALVWNRGDESTGWVTELDAVVRSVRPPGTPTFREGEWRSAFETSTLFTPLEERDFPLEVTADAASLRDRVASVSFVAALPAPEKADLLARIDQITARLPERFPYPYRTYVYVCSRTP